MAEPPKNFSLQPSMDSGQKTQEQLEFQARAGLENRRRSDLERCISDPLYWLQTHTKTRNDHWKEQGVEPYSRFPERPYFPCLFKVLLEEKKVFIPKSREMIVSWAVMGFLVHAAQFHGPQHILIQTQKEDKVKSLISGTDTPGYARVLYEQQDDWIKEKYPLTRPAEEMAGTVISWANGSKIEGLAGGAAQIRQYHPSKVFYDEAAFMDEWWASYEAAEPVTDQIISISSAEPSKFGDIVQDIMEHSSTQGQK